MQPGSEHGKPSTPDMEDIIYDVVVVGAGIAGSIASYELASKGFRVKILEAGDQDTDKLDYFNYLKYLDYHFKSVIKHPDSPYPGNPNAPAPDVLDLKPIKPPLPTTTGYFVQFGPHPFGSTYLRYTGGTTLHWLGTCLRLIPEDFKLKTYFGYGLDWPISYDDLMPYYERAEYEIGVSADVEDQIFLGIHFRPGYVYPMHKIPQSYLDKRIDTLLAGMKIEYDGIPYNLKVTSTPQGRNSTPNSKFSKDGKPYIPIGAVGNPEIGQRCTGNSSCIPICPIQAKYNALKTLHKGLATNKVTLETRAVASRVNFDTSTGYINGISYKTYKKGVAGVETEKQAKGKYYLLAAHSIENAKLLLQSGISSTSGLVGKNLMDHPVLPLSALMNEDIGSYRGPLSTSGIESLRGGAFRAQRAAFRIEIGNDGWSWPRGTPFSTVNSLLDQDIFGKKLIDKLRKQSGAELRLAMLLEQPAEESNSISIEPGYKDALGNFRPVIRYAISDYVKKGLLASREASLKIFERLGATDTTSFDANTAGYLEDMQLPLFGAGHFAGTHVMGNSRNNSVVNRRQQCWDHPNLFLTGCGNFPSVGTGNPTLTMAALAFWAADNLEEELKK
jgi:choline dehydrogenase-like flavoprotein